MYILLYIFLLSITRILYQSNSRYNEPDDGLITPKHVSNTSAIECKLWLDRLIKFFPTQLEHNTLY